VADELLWFVRVVETLSLLIGFTIAYYAHAAFRRSRHRSILLSALGFGLLSAGSTVEGVLFELLTMPLLTAQAFRAVIGLAGFILLLASVRGMKG